MRVTRGTTYSGMSYMWYRGRIVDRICPCIIRQAYSLGPRFARPLQRLARGVWPSPWNPRPGGRAAMRQPKRSVRSPGRGRLPGVRAPEHHRRDRLGRAGAARTIRRGRGFCSRTFAPTRKPARSAAAAANRKTPRRSSPPTWSGASRASERSGPGWKQRLQINASPSNDSARKEAGAQFWVGS